MRIAFHAPMKPPDHPTPSGDRAMARLLMRALRVAGHEVFLVSRLRTREPNGDAKAQAHLHQQARQEITLLSARLMEDPPDLWFTYHLYYKAPDLIGPALCQTLNIPYVVAEASHADRRLKGPYATFAAAVLEALAQARAVIAMTDKDRAGLGLVVPPEDLHRLKPFVTMRPAPLQKKAPGPLRLLAVGMLRHGDKLASYRLLAEALRHVRPASWTLTIAGHGKAERTVRTLFAPFGSQVTIVGAMSPVRLGRLYATHDLMVWPAVNEAYGMAMLEGSAFGLPVIAGDEGGVSDVVRHGENGLLVRRRDPHAMARAISGMIHHPQRLYRLQQKSWRHVGRGHRLAQAARDLDRIVRQSC